MDERKKGQTKKQKTLDGDGLGVMVTNEKDMGKDDGTS
jgi:hypothetical protein